MRRLMALVTALAICMMLAGCGGKETLPEAQEMWPDAVTIHLEDVIRVEGPDEEAVAAVSIGGDIIYYEEGKDFTYGEGTENDAHSAQEAAAHTVVQITAPGTYVLEGSLPKGQIAVDLGEDAEEDPEAVVTLVLNGVDITCEVAPAVIFYNVYECGSDDEETATKDVDTSAAGANVIIADDTCNHINGSYVARIYEPGTVELNEAGTEVEDADKLHKYDGAFYSRMSMNVDGGEKGSGFLSIRAENEGLDSELHLTINGGSIAILSGNDGINTNEDNVSVTTINGGEVSILVTGETGEGDGIDSNGWLVINGGKVTAAACSDSADAGIDSDMGIHINGGTVIATGHMLDHIEDGGQNYAVFQFAEPLSGEDTVTLKNEAGEVLMEHLAQNDYSTLIFSGPDLAEGAYTLWRGEEQLMVSTGMGGGFGAPRPGGERPELPEGMEPPEGFEKPERGKMPEGMEPPEGFGPPEDGGMPQNPGGMGGGDRPGGFGGEMGEVSETVTIQPGGNLFMVQ